MHSGIRFFCVLWLWFMLISTGNASEWKIASTLDQTIEYNDNKGLQINATPSFGYTLRPGFSANIDTATLRTGITAHGDIRRYDNKRWNCEAMSINFDQQYQMRLSVFSLSAGYLQNCSTSNKNIDNGIQQPNNQSETYTLSPAWNWQWSPLDIISFTPSYTKTVFSSTGSNNTGVTSSSFRGSETYNLNLSERHSWTRRLSSTASLFFSSSEFNNFNGPLKQTAFGFQVGNQYNITRKWVIDGGVGLRWVKSPNNSFSTTNNDSLLRTKIVNFSLNYTGQQLDSSLAYSRTASPSSTGQMLESNSFTMNSSYKMTKKLTLNFDGSFLKNKSVIQGQFQGQSTSNDRTYYSASIGMTWAFDKEWGLSTNYQYSRQQFTSKGQFNNVQNEPRTSNAIMFHLNYNWNGLRVPH